MKIRYWIYSVTIFILNLAFWYYILNFCGVYIKTGPGWVYASIQALLIDWFGFALLIPLTLSIVRLFVQRCTKCWYILFL